MNKTTIVIITVLAVISASVHISQLILKDTYTYMEEQCILHEYKKKIGAYKDYVPPKREIIVVDTPPKVSNGTLYIYTNQIDGCNVSKYIQYTGEGHKNFKVTFYLKDSNGKLLEEITVIQDIIPGIRGYNVEALWRGHSCTDMEYTVAKAVNGETL